MLCLVGWLCIVVLENYELVMNTASHISRATRDFPPRQKDMSILRWLAEKGDEQNC